MAQRIFENQFELDKFLIASVLMGVTPDKNETAEGRQQRAATLSRDIRLYAVEYHGLVEEGKIDPYNEGTDEERKKNRERILKEIKDVLHFFEIKDEDLKTEENSEQ